MMKLINFICKDLKLLENEERMKEIEKENVRYSCDCYLLIL